MARGSIGFFFEGVPALEDVLAGYNPMFRFSRTGGTMHHCFRGGWIWVIPFDNGVTSVGLQLDRDMYPLEEGVSPEDEVRRILDRYPSIAAHLGAMKPIRPLVRTDRVQFTSKTILGDGLILAPHAAAFIEPLYSTGIVLTLAFISRFAPLAREAKQAGDSHLVHSPAAGAELPAPGEEIGIRIDQTLRLDLGSCIKGLRVWYACSQARAWPPERR